MLFVLGYSWELELRVWLLSSIPTNYVILGKLFKVGTLIVVHHGIVVGIKWDSATNIHMCLARRSINVLFMITCNVSVRLFSNLPFSFSLYEESAENLHQLSDKLPAPGNIWRLLSITCIVSYTFVWMTDKFSLHAWVVTFNFEIQDEKECLNWSWYKM